MDDQPMTDLFHVSGTRLAACSCDRRPHVLPDKLCPIHYQQHTDHCEKFYINTQVLSKTPPAAAGKKH